jgi:hypothetical protein
VEVGSDAVKFQKRDLDLVYTGEFLVSSRELAFDTIELSRGFKADSISCSTLVPFHGTEICRMARTWSNL